MILGGEQGAVINASVPTISTSDAINKSMSTGIRVDICIAMYVVATAIEFWVAVSVGRLMRRF